MLHRRSAAKIPRHSPCGPGRHTSPQASAPRSAGRGSSFPMKVRFSRASASAMAAMSALQTRTQRVGQHTACSPFGLAVVGRRHQFHAAAIIGMISSRTFANQPALIARCAGCWPDATQNSPHVRSVCLRSALIIPIRSTSSAVQCHLHLRNVNAAAMRVHPIASGAASRGLSVEPLADFAVFNTAAAQPAASAAQIQSEPASAISSSAVRRASSNWERRISSTQLASRRLIMGLLSASVASVTIGASTSRVSITRKPERSCDALLLAAAWRGPGFQNTKKKSAGQPPTRRVFPPPARRRGIR